MQKMQPEDLLNRRKFLSSSARLLVMISSFSALSCACTNKEKEERRLDGLVIDQGKLVFDLTESRYRALNAIGAGLKIEITRQEKPLIIARVSETRVAAFSSECTHAGYEILLPERGVLACASGHGGTFDLEGRVLTGPPTSNLQSYPAQLTGNRVYVAYPLS